MKRAKGIISISNSNIVKRNQERDRSQGLRSERLLPCCLWRLRSAPRCGTDRRYADQPGFDSEDAGTAGCLRPSHRKHAQRLCTDQRCRTQCGLGKDQTWKNSSPPWKKMRKNGLPKRISHRKDSVGNTSWICATKGRIMRSAYRCSARMPAMQTGSRLLLRSL